MKDLYDVAAIGNAIVDVIAPCDDAFLEAEGLTKGSMQLIDQARATELYARMAKGVETSGGSAAYTMAGMASLGGGLGAGLLDRVAGVAQFEELDALHHAPVLDVQAGDDADLEHQLAATLSASAGRMAPA